MRKHLKKIKDDSLKRRYRKKLSIRAKVIGTPERPRLCVVKSNKHLCVQVIDDSLNKTIFSLQTYGKHAIEGASKSVDGGKKLGEAVGNELKKRGYESVVFDRNGRSYKGILAAVADSVRQVGVRF
ncbi:MAG: 50S ribosomal protein L18 [Oligoflexia bacterium]|nr:50S ribosomal protein L18 [Oligoflexia bacterium]